MYPVVPSPTNVFLATAIFVLFALLYFLTPPPGDPQGQIWDETRALAHIIAVQSPRSAYNVFLEFTHESILY